MLQLSAEDKTKILYDISMEMSSWSIDDKYNISHTTVSRMYKKIRNSGESFLFRMPGKKKSCTVMKYLKLNLNIQHKRHSLKFTLNVFLLSGAFQWSVLYNYRQVAIKTIHDFKSFSTMQF